MQEEIFNLPQLQTKPFVWDSTIDIIKTLKLMPFNTFIKLLSEFV